MKTSTAVRLRIGAVARSSGVSPSTIRSWERRYNGITPSRSDAGGRLYTESDVQRLLLLRRAVDAGHAIGSIAGLPDADIARLARASALDPARDLCNRFLEAVSRFDPETAEHELNRAAALFPQDRLVREVLAPLLREIGERWAHSEIGIAQEHLATSLIRALLVTLIRLQPPSAGGRPIVFGTLEGERHEMGLLLAAFLAAARRRRVVYLGTEVPAADLAHAARACNAAAIALSLVSATDATDALDLLAALAPGDTAVWLGGSAAQRHAAVAASRGWKVLSGTDDFDALLT